MVKVEVVYITSEQRIIHLHCHLPSEATVNDALMQSGILTCFPEVQDLPLGIFSKRVEKTTLLKTGDRIEIYRLLISDPKEKRRQRAKKVK